MFAFLFIFALSSVALAQRNSPHPCATATNSFVNDFGTCEAYFWCDSASVAYPTGPCQATYVFDEAAQVCNFDPTTPCDLCPGTGLWAV